METRGERVYSLKESIDDEIAIEIKKMENDLDLYADDKISAEEFKARIHESEAWIMHFVFLQENLVYKLKIDEERHSE